MFARVGSAIWHIYEDHYAEDDALYWRMARDLDALSDAELLDALDVRAEFRGGVIVSTGAVKGPYTRVDQNPPADAIDMVSEVSTAATPSTAAESDETVSLWRKPASKGVRAPGPYERASSAMSQIEASLASGYGKSPRELVESLTFTLIEMQTCALEAADGRMGLETMDDIMPTFIFVLIRSSLARPLTCARYMSDALSRDERLQSEGRAVLLLESAARYVARDWEEAPRLAVAARDRGRGL
jgi:hypothetical protein